MVNGGFKEGGICELEFEPEFFHKEVRCGFEISEMMKRAWAAELEVLQVVAEICERRGLQYFADWGTLLGAVRHQGFIPWDDDIDICLKREEYMELIRILPQELPKGFAMGGIFAETDQLRELCGFLKVIADDTWDINDYMKRFHGFPYQRIGVDIFPLDYMPLDKELIELQEVILLYGAAILQNWSEYEEKGELEHRLQYMEQLCNTTIPRNDTTKIYLWKIMDSIKTIYRADEADEIVEYQYFISGSEKPSKKEWYNNAVMLPFEQTEIAVPCAYHEVLTAKFGDYKTPDQSYRSHQYPFYRSKEKNLINNIRATGFRGTVEEFCQKVCSGELRIEINRKG